MKYNVEGLNTLSKQLHQFQIDAGFTDSNITQRLMLVHSEISEAFEAFRKDKMNMLKVFEEDLGFARLSISDWEAENENCNWLKNRFETTIKDTFEDEIADSVIRLLAMCGENDIDIEKHIQLKMKYNEMRGFKYGGKKF